jgi:hypothetical protein
MTKASEKMKKDTRTKPGKDNEPTRVTREPEKTGQQANMKQNTTNQGYQQDR